VPDLLITTLKKQLEHYNASLHDEQSRFQRGDPILIEDGPFAGHDAVFDIYTSGQERVRVLLNLLQRRQMPLEIPSKYIRRVKRS
jgi:transcriptional antiterminator RfaH